jgi:hypothetical protein
MDDGEDFKGGNRKRAGEREASSKRYGASGETCFIAKSLPAHEERSKIKVLLSSGQIVSSCCR